MTFAPSYESNTDSKPQDVVKKEWHRPILRKLPIAATAGIHVGGNEGNTSKGGKSGEIS